MNEQAASLAALNVSLLEAIQAGPATGPTELAERAGIDVRHVNRKLASLSEAGLILKTGEGSCDVALTEDGARGLAAMAVFRGEAPPVPAEGGLIYIPFDRIEAWTLNPRTQFDEAGVEDMAQSVADKGVLQPLTVRAKGDRFEVIIGERRRRGCTLAVQRGWVAADFLIPCQVKSYSDDEALDVAGVENLQRHDLHWMDEAKFYLRLAERGRSGAEIARLAGESVSKRKVQDYCMIARNLSPEDIARCYLPDGHKDQLLYTKARDLAGNRKTGPALELSPLLALAFAELIDAATLPEHDFAAATKVAARMHSPPTGGPLAKLADRKLVAYGFGGEDRHLEARITVTDDVREWLAHVGFLADRREALLRLRTEVVGEGIAATFHPGRWHTAELNAPEPAPSTPPAAASEPEPDPLAPSQRRVLREIAARSFHRTRLPDDAVSAHPDYIRDPNWVALYDLELVTRLPNDRVALTRKGVEHLKRLGQMPEAMSANSCATPWLRDDYAPGAAADQPDDADPGECVGGFEAEPHGELLDDAAPDASEELSPALLRLAGVPADAPASSPAPAAQPSLDDLPAMLAIVLIEAAHKIAAEGVERGPGTWAAPILANYYNDSRGQQLVMRRMLAFLPMGTQTGVCIPKAGQAWLAEHEEILFDNGKPAVAMHDLAAAQAELLGSAPIGRRYSAPWLNPPEAAAGNPPPQGEGDREAVEGVSAAAPADYRPEAWPDAPPTLGQLTDVHRALLACYGQLGQLDGLLSRLRPKATTTHQAEIDQHRKLIDAIRETAKAHLPEGVA